MAADGTRARDPAVLRQVLRVVSDLVEEFRAHGQDPRDRVAPGSAGSIRLSDAERAAAAEVVADAYAEGRLDLGEFEDRLTRIHSAHIRAELPPILADLPDAHRAATQQPVPEVLSAVLRDIRRTGEWDLPPRLRVLVRGGTALLDLRAARVRSDIVEINVHLTGGRVVVIVPDGVSVEVRDGLTVLGKRSDATVRRRNGARASRLLPRVVVSGEVVAGMLLVRSPTRRERWRDP